MGLGSATALATPTPPTKATTGTAPYVPPLVHGSFAAAAVTLTPAAAALPARRALRLGRT
ncbi:hypothetical protein ACIQV3_15755 [Streptomyces sp. NPDC099050]|uniref:hypothetical protein n=1 Tax=Streptomyces sp. NPDC099050 TaxID=3366100 RepID=UPI0037F9B6E0